MTQPETDIWQNLLRNAMAKKIILLMMMMMRRRRRRRICFTEGQYVPGYILQ
jgi:hypothetical protein